MEVTCQKCRTKYFLDESRIKGTQAKVRCSRCQNVFVVSLDLPVEEALTPAASEEKSAVLGDDAPGAESDSGSSGQLLSWLTGEEKSEMEEAPGAVAESAAALVQEPVSSLAPPRTRWYLWALVGIIPLLCLAGLGVWYYKYYKLPPAVPTQETAQASAGQSPGAASAMVPAVEFKELQIETQRVRYQGLVNKRGGQLLVVQGKVKNSNSQPRGPVALKIVLVDARHQPVSQSQFFCGSVFTDEELLNSSPEELNRWLSTPGGRNAKPIISPGDSQEFTGIMFGVPANLGEKGYGYYLAVVQGPRVSQP